MSKAKRLAGVGIKCRAESLEQRLQLSAVSFQPPQTFASGATPDSVAVADLGNGHPDLIVANQQDDTVSVLLGNGDGTFQAQQVYATDLAPYSVAVADLNGDAHPDIIVANEASGTVSVLLGNGNGTFQPRQTFATESEPLSVAVADLGNGHPDIITANFADATVSVLVGNGDGTFQAQQAFGTGLGPDSVAVADLGNGHPDLVVANRSAQSVSVLLGNGHGTFQTQQSFAVGLGPYSIAVADLGNGHPDVVTTNLDDDTVSVLLGNGNGTFQAQQALAAGISAASVAIADLGNGHPDLVVGDLSATSLSVLLGNGDGTFQSPETVADGTNGVAAVAVADINGDGAPDLIAANSGSGAASVNVLLAVPAVAPPGQDLTYGTSGRVTIPFTAQAQAVTADDKTVVAGYEGDPAAGTEQTVLERLNTDGTLDTSFGSGGMTVGTAGSGVFNSVQLQTDGRIVTAGNQGGNMIVERFSADGSVDTSLGSGGVATANLGSNSVAYSMVLDSSGDIVVAGTSGAKFALARFTPAGILDTTFASGGMLSFNVGSDDVLGQVLVQPDGKIVVVGGSGSSVIVVARLDSNGSFDPTFGGNPSAGITIVSGLVPNDVTTGVPDASEGIALQSDGKIVAVSQTPDGHFGVARLTAGGVLDTSFGAGGITTTSFGGPDDADAVTVDSTTGEIVVAGTTAAGGTPETAIASYLPNGTLDTNFGVNGMLALPAGISPLATPGASVSPEAFYSANFAVHAFIAPQPDKKFLVGTSGGTGKSSTVRRLIAPSKPQVLFNSVLHPTLLGRLPATALVAGQRIAPIVQTIRLTNTGATAITGNITVNIVLSADNTGQSGGITVATVPRTVNIKVGKMLAVPVAIHSLPGTAIGTLFLLAEATDPSGATALGASTGTVNSQAPFIDLSVVSLRVPAKAKAGRNAVFTLTVAENGNVPVTGQLPIDLLLSASGVLDTNSIDLGTIPRRVSILPNRRLVLLVARPIPASVAGSNFLIAKLDPGNTLNDTNLVNNMFVSAATVNVT